MIKQLKATIKPLYSWLRHRLSVIQVKRLVSQDKPVHLEVGAGPQRGRNGFLTIDVTHKSDIYWDLRKGFPFPDASVSTIYSSHFLEHLTYQEGQAFLGHCLRTLKPGGEFSICVPNARLYLEAYLSNTELDLNRYFAYKPAFNHTTRIDYVNYTAYMDGQHKYMFDESNLIYLLRDAGLKDAKLRSFNPKLDLEVRDFESIYAIAYR